MGKLENEGILRYDSKRKKYFNTATNRYISPTSAKRLERFYENRSLRTPLSQAYGLRKQRSARAKSLIGSKKKLKLRSPEGETFVKPRKEYRKVAVPPGEKHLTPLEAEEYATKGQRKRTAKVIELAGARPEYFAMLDAYDYPTPKVDAFSLSGVRERIFGGKKPPVSLSPEKTNVRGDKKFRTLTFPLNVNGVNRETLDYNSKILKRRLEYGESEVKKYIKRVGMGDYLVSARLHMLVAQTDNDDSHLWYNHTAIPGARIEVLFNDIKMSVNGALSKLYEYTEIDFVEIVFYFIKFVEK